MMLERTFQNMRVLARATTGLEVINNNYARLTFTDEELAAHPNVMNDIVTAINTITGTIKEQLGIDIKATTTGDKKTVVLIEGIGKLYESNPDEFSALIKLKRDVTGSPASMPTISSASAIAEQASQVDEKPAAKPAAARAVKPVKRAASPPEKPVQEPPAKPAAIPAKPAVKPAVKPAAAKPVEKPSPVPVATASQGGTERYFSVISSMLDASGIVGQKEVVEKLMSTLKISSGMANKMIGLYVNSNEKVLIEHDFILKKD
jgi:hypothetical protein